MSKRAIVKQGMPRFRPTQLADRLAQDGDTFIARAIETPAGLQESPFDALAGRLHRAVLHGPGRSLEAVRLAEEPVDLPVATATGRPDREGLELTLHVRRTRGQLAEEGRQEAGDHFGIRGRHGSSGRSILPPFLGVGNVPKRLDPPKPDA